MTGAAIGRDTVVSLAVTLSDAQNRPLAEPGERLTYLHGGYGGVPAPLERALEGKRAGEEVRVQVEPEDAYGEYDPALVRLEAAERYGEGLAVGMQVEEEGALYTVTDVAAGKAVLDGNHPLAGMALRFACRVLEVRPAREEEIRRGVSLP